jgi:hypothetical protein
MALFEFFKDVPILGVHQVKVCLCQVRNKKNFIFLASHRQICLWLLFYHYFPQIGTGFHTVLSALKGFPTFHTISMPSDP